MGKVLWFDGSGWIVLAKRLVRGTRTRGDARGVGRAAGEVKVSEERIAELTAQVGRLTEVVAASNAPIAELAAAANRKR